MNGKKIEILHCNDSYTVVIKHLTVWIQSSALPAKKKTEGKKIHD